MNLPLEEEKNNDVEEKMRGGNHLADTHSNVQ